MAGPVETVVDAFATQELFVQALLGGLVVAGMTLFGASLVLVWRGMTAHAR